MERQNVIALLQYLQRAAAIAPTTGIEWESIRQVLGVLEQVAAGKVTVEVKPIN